MMLDPEREMYEQLMAEESSVKMGMWR